MTAEPVLQLEWPARAECGLVRLQVALAVIGVDAVGPPVSQFLVRGPPAEGRIQLQACSRTEHTAIALHTRAISLTTSSLQCPHRPHQRPISRPFAASSTKKLHQPLFCSSSLTLPASNLPPPTSQLNVCKSTPGHSHQPSPILHASLASSGKSALRPKTSLFCSVHDSSSSKFQYTCQRQAPQDCISRLSLRLVSLSHSPLGARWLRISNIFPTLATETLSQPPPTRA